MSDKVTIRGAESPNWLLYIVLAIVLFAGDPSIFEGLKYLATSDLQECTKQENQDEER